MSPMIVTTGIILSTVTGTERVCLVGLFVLDVARCRAVYMDIPTGDVRNCPRVNIVGLNL
jgi:hypothetical protein